jgi:parvulin-like peptidyl-prolyl isomerase
VNKPTLKSDAAIKALSLILAASVSLTACEAPKARKSTTNIGDTTGKDATGDKGKKTDNSRSNTTGLGTSGTTPEATATSTATSTDTATTTSASQAGGGTAGNTAEAPPQGPSELDDLPQLSAVRTVSLSKLRDSLVVCTVDGTPITIEAFKREFREALLSLQAMLTTQPGKVNELLARARQMGTTLTDDEHKRLLETAKKKESLGGKTLAAFLKDKKITEQQFNEQVLMLGLAFKAGTTMIESQLLSDMINRELLLEAARSAGMYRLAMNKFIEFKHSSKYDEVLKSSNETADQIRDDVINHEMMIMMMEQIAKQANVSDDILKAEYEKNKQGFKHGERLRLSHIVIAAPSFDNPPLLSIRTQIQKQKPHISATELDAEEKVLQMQQHNLAAEILARAVKGEDFKTLADRYTSDDGARAMKTGGDLGFVDLSLKVPGANGAKSDQEKLTDAVQNLKVGGIAQDLVHTAYGWHIVKLTAKQPAGYIPFEEAKGTLKQLLSQQNRDLAEITWMKDRRKHANIKVSDEFNKVAAIERASAGSKPTAAP